MSPASSGFAGGTNIAVKTPPHEYEAMVAFYRDVLQLPLAGRETDSTAFLFGPNHLWVDRAPGLSQAEVWLELAVDDLQQAEDRLAAAGIQRRDEIEPLPEGLKAIWISAPANVIHLVCEKGAAGEE